jgi:hypothetical protein
LALADENFEFALNLGVAIGQNFHLMKYEDQIVMLCMAFNDDNITDGLGYGLSLNFSLLDTNIKEKILKVAQKKYKFTVGLGKGLWYSFSSLTDEDKINMLESVVTKRKKFANSLGNIIGIHYNYLSKNLQQKAWELAEKNTEFMAGLMYSLCFIYPSLSEDIRNKIWEIVKKNRATPIETTKGFNIVGYLGSGMGSNFPQLQYEEQVMILDLIKESTTFAEELAAGLGEKYHLIPSEDVRKKIFEIARENIIFAEELAPGLGKTFHFMKYKDQIKIMELTENNSTFTSGLFHAFGDQILILNEDIREKIWKIADESTINGETLRYWLSIIIGRNFPSLKYKDKINFLRKCRRDGSMGSGLAAGLGEKYHLIPSEDVRKKIFEIARENTDFAEKLGYSLSHNFSYMNEGIQEKILEIDMIDKFTSNLAKGIGQDYLYVNEKIKRKIWEKVEVDKEFASSMGDRICDILNVLGKEEQEYIFSIVEKNSSFAAGFGYNLGYKYAFLRKDIQEKIFTLITTNNNNFTTNFGETLGRNFLHVKEDLQKKILEIGKENIDFMSNLIKSSDQGFQSNSKDHREEDG